MFAFRELVEQESQRAGEDRQSEHGKVESDAKGEVIRGMEVVEFACGIPQLLKGEYSEQVSTDVDAYSFRQPLGVVRRHHAVQLSGDGADVDASRSRSPWATRSCSSRASATRRRRISSPSFMPTPACLTACSTSCTVTRWRSTRYWTIPASPPCRFVGSTPIAKYVHQRASNNGKRVQALGGAKNHAVVLPDADMDFAANHITAAGYGSAGERCMAISAVVAVGSAGDALVAELKQKAQEVKVGPGNDGSSEMGPIVTPESRDRIVGYVDRGEQAGATLVVDGRGLVVDGHDEASLSVRRCSTRCRPDMDIYTDEIFGPVLSVVRVASLDEAIDLVNANPYGNGTAIFTSSGKAAQHFQRHVHVGMIGINVPDARYRWPSTPSAAGRTHCSETLTCTAPRGSLLHARQGNHQPVAGCPVRGASQRAYAFPDRRVSTIDGRDLGLTAYVSWIINVRGAAEPRSDRPRCASSQIPGARSVSPASWPWPAGTRLR